MTTERQILANRRNGRLSRGPKTAQGKRQSSRNALRHGLSIKAARDPALARQINELAHVIADTSDPARFLKAMQVAEGEVELRRVREVRTASLDRQVSLNGGSTKEWERIEKLDRYERRALTRVTRNLQDLD